MLLGGLALSLWRKSLEVCVRRGVVVDREDGRETRLEYFVYAFMGKRAKNNMRLAALSYCHKLSTLLNNSQRIKIMTGGGVYRNKKLQLGSVLPLCKSKNASEKNLADYAYIHLVAQLMKSSSRCSEMQD